MITGKNDKVSLLIFAPRLLIHAIKDTCLENVIIFYHLVVLTLADLFNFFRRGHFRPL